VADGRRPCLWPIPVHRRRGREDVSTQVSAALRALFAAARIPLDSNGAASRPQKVRPTSTSTSTFIVPRPMRTDRDEQSERQRARRLRGLRRAWVMVGIRAALGAPLRERGALCTAEQRVGRKPRKALRADRDSSSHDSNLENRHDRGQDHHRPKVSRTRGTAAADHSGQAARPRRRSRIVGSTS
jgi:hypothetical protein